jgi:hypothetical protein
VRGMDVNFAGEQPITVACERHSSRSGQDGATVEIAAGPMWHIKCDRQRGNRNGMMKDRQSQLYPESEGYAAHSQPVSFSLSLSLFNEANPA